MQMEYMIQTGVKPSLWMPRHLISHLDSWSGLYMYIYEVYHIHISLQVHVHLLSYSHILYRQVGIIFTSIYMYVLSRQHRFFCTVLNESLSQLNDAIHVTSLIDLNIITTSWNSVFLSIRLSQTSKSQTRSASQCLLNSLKPSDAYMRQ